MTVHGLKGYIEDASPIEFSIVADYYPPTASEPFQYRCVMVLDNGKKLYASGNTPKQSYKKIMSIYREIRAIEKRMAAW